MIRDGPDPTAPVTVMLRRVRTGDPEALAQLVSLVYDELKTLASRQRRKVPAYETLNTTALVHEAFIKLTGGESREFEDRCHFFATAATAMRHLAVDYARRKNAARRGGGRVDLPIDQVELGAPDQTETVLAIDESLTRLAGHDRRMAQVVECRFFGGMTERETATVLGVTERTVRRDWAKARAWLHTEFSEE